MNLLKLMGSSWMYDIRGNIPTYCNLNLWKAHWSGEWKVPR